MVRGDKVGFIKSRAADVPTTAGTDGLGASPNAALFLVPAVRLNMLYFFHSRNNTVNVVSVDIFSKCSSSHEVLLVPVITLDYIRV